MADMPTPLSVGATLEGMRTDYLDGALAGVHDLRKEQLQHGASVRLADHVWERERDH